MFNKLNIKCVAEDEYKTLTIDKEYEIQGYYKPQNQIFIMCDREYLWWYSLDLFEDIDRNILKEVYLK